MIAYPRISLANPQILSDNSGFLLCGIEEDPVWPLPNGSSTSLISVLCKLRISVANFSKELAITDIVVMNWACLSRWIIWFDIGAGLIPNFWHATDSTDGGTVAFVPTGPEILPTDICSIASSNLFLLRFISSNQRAIFKPKVIGSAWIPWVLPIIKVSLCSIAFLRNESMTKSSSSWISFEASIKSKLVLVSQTSLVVIPKWIHLPSSPRLPVTDCKKAVISCLVTSKIWFNFSMS